MSSHRITRIAMAALAVGAVAAPTAGARADGPITNPHSAPAAAVPVYQDLRTPDAKDGYVFSRSPSVDLRSPDAIDAATTPKHTTGLVPPVQVVHLSDKAKSDFDWGDAGIGAGTVAGLALLALGGTAMVTRRRPGLRIS
jgi:hypothetical protein